MVEGPSDTVDEPLQVLLAVQDLDTAILQHEHRKATLAEREEAMRVRARLQDLQSRTSQLEAQRLELAERQDALEAQVASISSRRSSLEERLYGARGSAARDLQAMNEEIGHLTQRRSEVEDAELEVMEALEPIDEELARLSAERAELESAAQAAGQALREAEAVVEAEMAELAARRSRLVAGLPSALTDRYDVLRQRLGGVGAARLVGNRCEGCHLELPAVEVDRIRHLPPEAVVTCDQCGRILVRPRA